MKSPLIILATVAISTIGATGAPAETARKMQTKMLNPYAKVDWKTAHQIVSASHIHLSSQGPLDNAVKYGMRFIPISNYYPSIPYDNNPKRGDFKLRQHWPALRSDGTELPPPVNWNKVITWQKEINEKYRKRMPFKESKRVFSRIPDNVILSPNAEHHSFTGADNPGHICTPGSNFVSGNFEVRDSHKMRSNGFAVGVGKPWAVASKEVFAKLKYPDGGGIVINHPTWFSRLSDKRVFRLLDSDPNRVLGIEIYNDTIGSNNKYKTYNRHSETELGFSLNLWDRILASGRRCWGFAVPDHQAKRNNWQGRIILLVPKFTERECLKAYRNGNFYACLKDNGLRVTGFSADKAKVAVALNRSGTIKFITNAGVVATHSGKNAVYELKASQPTYVRVEVSDADGERLFLQPVMYKQKKHD